MHLATIDLTKLLKLLRVFLYSFLLFLVPNTLFSQIRVSGFVKDSLTREVLVAAHVGSNLPNRMVTTDNSGYFSIPVNHNGYIKVSFVGYKEKLLRVMAQRDTLIEILMASGEDIDEVVITHTKRTSSNISSISRAELQQIPSMGAKPDVMKSIQLLPGVQTQNEGSSLVMVRGGNPGENLYLFDNVSLIYVNHLGGFMSVFNPDMINNIDIYKGGFPSRYGGKLSSIMDITQREGNPKSISGNLSLGITDASFLVEGPTPIANTTFLVTGRKTLIDPLMALASKISGQGFVTAYGFHDLNAKFTWRPNQKNAFAINVYQGDDYLNFWYKQSSRTSTENGRLANLWGNWLLSARWSRVHSPKVFSSQSLSYVRYRLSDRQTYSYKTLNDGLEYSHKYISSVQDISYKWGWKAELTNNWRLEFGTQTALLQHLPNSVTQSNSLTIQNEPKINSLETAIYLDNIWTFRKIFTLRTGARGVYFATSNFNRLAVEPRVNLDINISQGHSVNFTYMDVTQFSHLLFTAGSIMSNEVWVPSGNGINPARSQQLSAGWQGSFAKGLYSAEVNFFNKKLADLSTFREGYSNLMGDSNWRTKILSGGTGDAFGAELFVRKNYGKWTGFLSYTWSKTTRKFGGINNGQEYLFDYDRPHSLSLNLNRKLNDKLTISTTWVYQSGLPFTPVVGRQFTPRVGLDGETYMYEAFIYGERNSERMQSYHRLDLALHYTTHNKRNGYKTEWSFSVYNAYNRKNPYSYYYTHGKNEDSGWVPFQTQSKFEPYSLYKVSFFPIIPTLSYKVIFDNTRLDKSLRNNKKSFFYKLLFH